jgi:hypothetical protein
VPRCMPTKAGDALILETNRSFTIYVVGAVSTDGQQDLGGQATDTRHVSSLAAATVLAEALLQHGGRIFRCDVDTDDWSQISGDTSCP